MKSRICFKQLFVCTIILITAVNVYSQASKGTNAPVFNLRDSKGTLVKPFEEPKPVLLSFFFTECANCRKEIKELDDLYLKYNDKVTIFLVGTSFKQDVEISEDVADFIKEITPNFTPLVDKYKDVIKTYGVTSYPSLYLINSKGKIVFTSSSYNEKTIKNLEKQIKSVK